MKHSGHFSMRLEGATRSWLEDQAKRLTLPMTKTIFRLFSFFEYSNIPEKLLLLVRSEGGVTLTGERWNEDFTGSARVNLLGDFPISALEIRVQSQSFDDFEKTVRSMISA